MSSEDKSDTMVMFKARMMNELPPNATKTPASQTASIGKMAHKSAFN